MSSFTFSFHFLLAWSAVYRINLSNSISNILPGDSRKKGGSIDRSVHCVLSRIMHFIRSVMKLLFPFFSRLYTFSKRVMMFFWCGRGALGNACAFSSAQHVGSTPPHVFKEDRWSFVSNMRFWVTSSHAFLFIFPQCRYLNKSVSALRLRFLTSVHPFLMTASPALRVAGDAGAHPNFGWSCQFLTILLHTQSRSQVIFPGLPHLHALDTRREHTVQTQHRKARIKSATSFLHLWVKEQNSKYSMLFNNFAYVFSLLCRA